MKKYRSTYLLIAMLILLAMIMAACGGDDEGDNNEDNGNNNTAPPPTVEVVATDEATGQPATTEAAGGDTGTLDGEALVNERCTVCHTRERIDNADKDEAGWTETVDRMIGHGAVLSDEERAAVIQYLTETH